LLNSQLLFGQSQWI